jgi:hypothetical protein
MPAPDAAQQAKETRIAPAVNFGRQLEAGKSCKRK